MKHERNRQKKASVRACFLSEWSFTHFYYSTIPVALITQIKILTEAHIFLHVIVPVLNIRSKLVSYTIYGNEIQDYSRVRNFTPVQFALL